MWSLHPRLGLLERSLTWTAVISVGTGLNLPFLVVHLRRHRGETGERKGDRGIIFTKIFLTKIVICLADINNGQQSMM